MVSGTFLLSALTSVMGGPTALAVGDNKLILATSSKFWPARGYLS